jgi:DNA-binding Lrp family transcriptional regulator
VSTSTEPWAKVPESAADAGLDATALNVLILLASKAGRDRLAWTTQTRLGGRLGVSRQAIGKAIRRLERCNLIRKAGRYVYPDSNTWCQRYEVAPYLHVATPEVAAFVGDEVTMQPGGGHDATWNGHDATPGVSQSSSKKAVPRNSESDREEDQERHAVVRRYGGKDLRFGTPGCSEDCIVHKPSGLAVVNIDDDVPAAIAATGDVR